MAYDAVLKPAARPADYQPPAWKDVEGLLTLLKRQRQPVIDRMWEVKRVRRRQWDDVIRHIPKAYRKMLVAADAPQFEDQIRRLAGLVAKHEPVFEVLPPSGRPPDVAKASREEARLQATRMQIADQQDRDPYAMGIDAQISLGESWLSVWPDPRRFQDPAFKRGQEEDADEYLERTKGLMAEGGVPITICDNDPQTVFPFRGDGERLAVCLVETEHQPIEISLGYGYKPVRDADGKALEWLKRGHTLSEPYLAQESRSGEGTSGVVDTTHDRGGRGSGQPEGPVRKVVYMDPWCYQLWLDCVLVEQWEHNWGVVPMFPAYGSQSSDRDPGYQSSGILDPIITVAKQVVYFSAILASNAAQYGFPTPMMKNAEGGLTDVHGQPLSRSIQLGELNFLGPNEELEFPFLKAQMGPDFFRYMEYLSGQMDELGIGGLAKALGSDMAGYAIAQIRSQQMAVLAPVYYNACRQWRKIAYFLRWLVRKVFPAGFFLRGAVEESDDGVQYRPIMKYGKEHCTDFAINAHIDEGIAQDQMAQDKGAIEKLQAGIWSRRRAMEKTGVEDAEAEAREIHTDRVISSPAADEVVLRLATQIMAERQVALTRQEASSPFHQALEQAKQSYMGGGGQFANQGGEPVNALPGGQPIQQNPPPATPQQGGPMAGPPAGGEGFNLQGMGIPGLPGGVEGGQVPVGSPG